MSTLHDCLWSLTVDQIKSRLTLLDVQPASSRKADLIQAIMNSLTGNLLSDLWDALSPLEQKAVSEACYAPDFALSEDRFAAKYGESPGFYLPRKEKRSYSSWDKGDPGPLTTFFFSQAYQHSRFIPDDLAAQLLDFVPRPDPLTIIPIPSPRDEPGLLTRSTEQEALRDLPTLLRLAEQGKLKATAKTGMPTATGKKIILEALAGGDYFPPEVASPKKTNPWEQEIGPIKTVGWIRLLQAGGYLSSGSKLNPAGIKALSQPRHEIILHLWKKWLTNKSFDEFNRIDEIKGQRSKGHMTAKPPRRQAITTALQECPANEWIETKTLSTFMQAEAIHFDISHAPHKLYLCEHQYGHLGYDGSGGWNILQHRYLLAFLFEYAAPLGLIDIAYVDPNDALPDFADHWGADDLSFLSRYDGLRAFRINNLGAYCLGLKDTFTEAKPETTLSLQLSNDLTIRLLSDTIPPAETLLLETWAEPITTGTWQLDPLRARDAIERGNNADDFLNFLQQCDEQPLPQTIEGFLKTAQSNGTALQNAGQAQLFTCRDEQTATMIAQHKTLAKLCSPCSKTQLVVPAQNVKKFQKQVRSLGLGIV